MGLPAKSLPMMPQQPFSWQFGISPMACMHSLFDLSWLPSVSEPHDQLPSTEVLRQEALRLAKLQHILEFTISLQNLSQHTIAEKLKLTVLKTLAKSISSLLGSNHRLPGLDMTGPWHTQLSRREQACHSTSIRDRALLKPTITIAARLGSSCALPP